MAIDKERLEIDVVTTADVSGAELVGKTLDKLEKKVEESSKKNLQGIFDAKTAEASSKKIQSAFDSITQKAEEAKEATQKLTDDETAKANADIAASYKQVSEAEVFQAEKTADLEQKKTGLFGALKKLGATIPGVGMLVGTLTNGYMLLAAAIAIVVKGIKDYTDRIDEADAKQRELANSLAETDFKTAFYEAGKATDDFNFKLANVVSTSERLQRALEDLNAVVKGWGGVRKAQLEAWEEMRIKQIQGQGLGKEEEARQIAAVKAAKLGGESGIKAWETRSEIGNIDKAIASLSRRKAGMTAPTQEQVKGMEKAAEQAGKIKAAAEKQVADAESKALEESTLQASKQQGGLGGFTAELVLGAKAFGRLITGGSPAETKQSKYNEALAEANRAAESEIQSKKIADQMRLEREKYETERLQIEKDLTELQRKRLELERGEFFRKETEKAIAPFKAGSTAEDISKGYQEDLKEAEQRRKQMEEDRKKLNKEAEDFINQFSVILDTVAGMNQRLANVEGQMRNGFEQT